MACGSSNKRRGEFVEGEPLRLVRLELGRVAGILLVYVIFRLLEEIGAESVPTDLVRCVVVIVIICRLITERSGSKSPDQLKYRNKARRQKRR